jgi:threonine dehydratase
LDVCRRDVDEFILVTEDEIRDALRLLIEKHHMLLEGAGALSVASFIRAQERFEGKQVVLVLSGCKISLDTLRRGLGRSESQPSGMAFQDIQIGKVVYTALGR